MGRERASQDGEKGRAGFEMEPMKHDSGVPSSKDTS